MTCPLKPMLSKIKSIPTYVFQKKPMTLLLTMVTSNWLATKQWIYDLPLIIASCQGFHSCMSNSQLAHCRHKGGWSYLQGHFGATHRLRLWLITRKKRRRRTRKFQSLFHGSHFVGKSTCIFDMTIASCFLLEFGNVHSKLKLFCSFVNYSLSAKASTTWALHATSKHVC